MLVDLSKSENEVLNYIRNSEKYQLKNFDSEYNRLRSEISKVVSAAKIYIVDNHKKINDYKDLSLMLRCANHDNTVYIGRKEKRKKRKSGIIDKILAELNRVTIEVDVFNEAIYDWSDGDFSVVFNGVGYNWIDSNSIINIANYIEERIDKLPNNTVTK